MGTSSMYSGYSNGGNQRNPLLPIDFNDTPDGDNNQQNQNEDGDQNEQQEKNNSKPEATWQSVKNYMSRVASGNSKNLKGAVSQYVKAHGGSRKATQNAISGVRTTISLGDFLNNASTQGLKETLESYNIAYKNKSIEEVLNDLINYLSPTPITKEESIARKALILTMEKLYELIENENLNIELIDKLDGKTLNVIIPIYVSDYIYERIINDLGSRIEGNAINSYSAVKLEKELKEYIISKVEITFKNRDLSKKAFSKKEVESLYNQCYIVMEDLL